MDETVNETQNDSDKNLFHDFDLIDAFKQKESFVLNILFCFYFSLIFTKTLFLFIFFFLGGEDSRLSWSGALMKSSYIGVELGVVGGGRLVAH